MYVLPIRLVKPTVINNQIISLYLRRGGGRRKADWFLCTFLVFSDIILS